MKLRITPTRLFRRATAYIRTDSQSVRIGFFASLLSIIAGLVAGIVLGSVTNTLLLFPGLVVLAPAAVGLRGNIHGALASRLSTMQRLDNLRFSKKLNTPMGQNILSSIILSVSCSFFLAAIAKIISEAFGVEDTISFLDFIVISIIGGIIPTVLELLFTVYLAKLCVKRNWDLDNVASPLITAAGDMETIPSLVLATLLVGIPWVTPIISISAAALAIGLFIYGLTTKYSIARQVVRQSFLLLIAGGVISIFAGLTIQARIDDFASYPIFLVFVPPLFSTNGAIGSIFSARIATKLHLGTLRTDKFSFTSMSEDVTLSYVLSVSIFLMLGLFCAIYSVFGHLQGPGWLVTIAISFIAGVVSTSFSTILGYFTAILTYRFGFDPDNFAVPAVTSMSDLIGAIVLMATLGVFRI